MGMSMKKSGRMLCVMYTKTAYMYLLTICIFLAALSWYSYYTHPYARLRCVQHASISNQKEDNDCTIVRTVYAQGNEFFSESDPAQRPLWALRAGAYVDFAFEVEKVFVGVANVRLNQIESSPSSHGHRLYHNRRHQDRRYNPNNVVGVENSDTMLQYQYFEVNRDGSVWWVEDRKLGSIDKVTHSHLIVIDEGHVVLSEEDEKYGKQDIATLTIQQVLEDMGSCEMAVLIQANNGRVYSFFEFDCPNHRRRRSYSSLLDYTAISFARGIAEYIEKSSEDSHHKHNIELVHDLSVIHIYFMTALATLAFAISIFPIARTKVIIDANTGTLTILKGSILVRHGGLERNNSGHICALENLVRARVSKTNVIQVSRPHGLTKGAEYSLRLDLAGLGATSALSAHSSGSYESVIEIGDSQADDAQLRRICEAINDLIFEYSGADPSSSRLESGVYNEYSITTNRHVFSNGTATREAVNTSVTRSSSVCAICLTRQSNCVLFPCRHMRSCSHCAVRLTHCPICRTHVVEKCTVFL